MPEWLAATSAPVLYWEQGHEWVFGDPVRLQVRVCVCGLDGWLCVCVCARALARALLV